MLAGPQPGAVVGSAGVETPTRSTSTMHTAQLDMPQIGRVERVNALMRQLLASPFYSRRCGVPGLKWRRCWWARWATTEFTQAPADIHAVKPESEIKHLRGRQAHSVSSPVTV